MDSYRNGTRTQTTMHQTTQLILGAAIFDSRRAVVGTVGK